MTNKNFLLLSLEDTKIKKVSNVISNESCRKILDYLSNKEATESELAEKLNIPISTVHYNLQQLMQTGLISADEYHYSKKGKEISHYKLANKYIIIAPKTTYGIKEKLKGILPIALIIGATKLILQYFQKFFVKDGIMRIFTETKQTLVRDTFITQKIADTGLVSEAASVASVEVAQEEAVSTAPAAAQEVINKTSEYLLTPEVVTQTTTTPASIWANIALWFFIGAVFTLVMYFLISLYRKD